MENDKTPTADESPEISHTEPMPGTWADTARLMAEIDPDFDWDAWKDEMKESDLL